MKELYTVNKKALIDIVSEKSNQNKKDIIEIVDCIFETIKDSLQKDKKVDIAGFGKFEVIQRDSRTGINPLTKEKIVIPATKTLKFKPGKQFKNKVNNK